MNKKIKQKFILVIGNNFSELNELLEDSWIIEKFHSHIAGAQSRCYVLLVKEVYE